jgi:hypothetical protein
MLIDAAANQCPCAACMSSPGWPLPAAMANPPPVQVDQVPVDVLIGPSFSQFAGLLAAASANSLAVYLHTNGGPVIVGGGEYGAQTIETLPVPPSLQEALATTLGSLRQKLGVDLWLTRVRSQASIEIFVDQTIDLGNSLETLGVTLANNSTGANARRWTEIILNGSELVSNPSLLQYALNHELGHALGLEHTFDGSDGDYYRSLDPERSATPEQTVMSYRLPQAGSDRWPSTFSANDIAALTTIWGPKVSATDQISPYVLSSQLQGSQLSIRFSEAIKPAAARLADIRIRVDGKRIKPIGVSLEAAERRLLIDLPASATNPGSQLSWSYRPKLARDAICDLASNPFNAKRWQEIDLLASAATLETLG